MRPELQSLVLPVISLIQGSLFRRKYGSDDTNEWHHFSLNIHSLFELVDMYHARDATDRRDKVYALLGMGTDSPNLPELSPDYKLPWKDVFRTLVELSLSKQISVKTWDDVELAIIEAKGHFLGTVSSLVETGASTVGRQNVEITWFGLKGDEDEKTYHTFWASANPIQVGDFICLLQGASQPTVVRLRNSFLTLIRTVIPQTDKVRQRWVSITSFSNDLILFWDWGASRGMFQSGEGYDSFRNTRAVPKCPRNECQCQSYLHSAIRLWNTGLWLRRLGRVQEANNHFTKASRALCPPAGLSSANEAAPVHYPWREADVKARRLTEEAIQDLSVQDEEVIEVKDKGCGQTPLTWAAGDSYKALLQLLLTEDAEFEEPYLLDVAVKFGYEVIARLLLDHSPNSQPKDDRHIFIAAQRGHEAIVRLLVDRGADIESYTRKRDASCISEIGYFDEWIDDNMTPLQLAAQEGHEAVVRLLVDRGADIESRKAKCSTPLELAAEAGHEAVMLFLINRGARFDALFDMTMLGLAAQRGYEAAVRLLVDKGAEIESCNIDGESPLRLAAEAGYEAVVRILIDKGARFDEWKGHETTPLQLAAKKGHAAVVQVLLDSGANIESHASSRHNPLELAAKAGHEAVVRVLIDRNGRLHYCRSDGLDHSRTPLQLAVKRGHEAVVRTLLEGGVDPWGCEYHLEELESYAQRNGHKAIVQLLKSYMNGRS
jgi:ankyrin repeat protein